MYEQWLHADLREVVLQPCIPSSVVEQHTTQITGHFIVQVGTHTHTHTHTHTRMHAAYHAYVHTSHNIYNVRTCMQDHHIILSCTCIYMHTVNVHTLIYHNSDGR